MGWKFKFGQLFLLLKAIIIFITVPSIGQKIIADELIFQYEDEPNFHQYARKQSIAFAQCLSASEKIYLIQFTEGANLHELKLMI